MDNEQLNACVAQYIFRHRVSYWSVHEAPDGLTEMTMGTKWLPYNDETEKVLLPDADGAMPHMRMLRDTLKNRFAQGWVPIPSYTTSPRHMEWLIDEMLKKGWHLVLHYDNEMQRYYASFADKEILRLANSPFMKQAIVKAALYAVANILPE